MKYNRCFLQVLCVILIVFGVLCPSILLLFTGSIDTDATAAEQSLLRSLSTHERKPLDYLSDSREVSELKQQIRELEEIRSSVRDELRVFEQQRTKLSLDITTNKDNLAKVKKEFSNIQLELQDKRGKLSKVNRDFYDKVELQPAPVANIVPIIILPAENNKLSTLSDLEQLSQETKLTDLQFSQCSSEICFNYASCPLTRPFSVYVYNDINPSLFPSHHDPLMTEFISWLRGTQSYTTDPDTACVYVVIIDSDTTTTAGGREERRREIEERIHSLSHWNNDGLNHVLIELSTSKDDGGLLDSVTTQSAIIAKTVISPSKPFRHGYDILLPPLPITEIGWRDLPTIIPVSRTNLLYFHGDYHQPQQPTHNSITPHLLKSLKQALDGRESIDFELQCPGSDTVMLENAREGEWALCGGQHSRLEYCSHSMFSLVPSPSQVIGNGIGTATYTRLIESLMCGSIPVIIGTRMLPFDEVIDWSRAAVIIPVGRFREIHYILRSIDHNTILDLRMHGRHLLLTYFKSAVSVVQSVIAMLRYRALHIPPISPDFIGQSLYTHTTNRKKRINSPIMTQNFTTYSSRLWNEPPGPFFIYPMTPFKPGPISGYQYSQLDDRAIARLPIHILDGGGITGPNFEDLLLGNSPEEQFTVVMLTYQRNKVLVDAIARLEDVSFLNKVVIVWNNEENPPEDLIWPDIGVPVEVGGDSHTHTHTHTHTHYISPSLSLPSLPLSMTGCSW